MPHTYTVQALPWNLRIAALARKTKRITGLSRGNLSSHLGRLEEEGMVTITKRFEGKIPHTRASLTSDGRKRIAFHWEQLEDLRIRSDRWQPQSTDE